MDNDTNRTYTAFAGHRMLATGPLRETLRRTKEQIDRGGSDPILIFEDQTGQQVDFDFRGTLDEVWEREAPVPQHIGPGRPRLGVVSREVSLLPRHWEWLEGQPNGASAALRRLVEEARKRSPGEDRARLATNSASKFMWAMTGDFPGFEEASRALFARNRERFEELIRDWPGDIRAHLQRLVEPCFAGAGAPAPLTPR
jgi:hypothetical protein